jgi:hypothetical protein
MTGRDSVKGFHARNQRLAFPAQFGNERDEEIHGGRERQLSGLSPWTGQADPLLDSPNLQDAFAAGDAEAVIPVGKSGFGTQEALPSGLPSHDDGDSRRVFRVLVPSVPSPGPWRPRFDRRP